MSDAIVPVAIEWLRASGQAAQFVRVVRHDEDAEAAGKLLADLVAEVHADLPDRVRWTVLQHDDAVPAIVDLARSEQVALIAMATHGRTGLSRVTVGRVTNGVVHDAPCPVLTVRPRELVR